MSERVPHHTVEKHPSLKRKLARVAAAATGLALGLGLFTNSAAQPVENSTIPAVAATVKPKPTTSPPAPTSCKPLPEHMIAGRAEKIQRELQERQTGVSSTLSGKQAIAQSFGVKLVDSDATVAKISTAKGLSNQLAIGNAFTQKVHGFNIIADSIEDPQIVSLDLKKVIKELDDVPPALSKAMNLDTLVLASAETKENGSAGFVILSEAEPNNIWLREGSAESFKHEYSHHIQGAYQEKVCSSLPKYAYPDPEYASNNPDNFAYKRTSGLKTAQWAGVTISDYGSTTVREDQATLGAAMLDQDINSYPPVRQSDVLARKAATIALHMDTLAKGTGNYVLNHYLERAPAPGIPQGTPN